MSQPVDSLITFVCYPPHHSRALKPGCEGAQHEGQGRHMAAALLVELILCSASHITHDRVVKPGSGELRHGTEGWHSLETSCRALGQMLEGSGEASRPWLTEDMRELIARWMLGSGMGEAWF